MKKFLEVEKTTAENQENQTGGTDAVPERHHRRGKLV